MPFTNIEYDFTYVYDQANRLIEATGNYGTGTYNFQLYMEYFDDGAIKNKDQDAPQSPPKHNMDWSYDYDHDGTNTGSEDHTLYQVNKVVSGESEPYREYDFNSSGSVIEIKDIEGENRIARSRRSGPNDDIAAYGGVSATAYKGCL